MFESRCIVSSTETDVCADPAFDLVAGTGWALSRPAVDVHAATRPIDVLFVDEAGQLSLADVLAAGTAARSLVLLGDPNQLPQVSQGSHPEALEGRCSQHLLREHDRPARPRAVPRGDVAPTARALRVHVGRLLRGKARVRARGGASQPGARKRRAVGSGRARGPRPVVGGGGGGHRGRSRRAARNAVHGQGRRHATAPRARHPGGRAVQRAGADAAGEAARGRRGRDGRQVPGAAGSGGVRLDGELDDRGRAARDRVRLRLAPLQRGDLRAQCRAVLVCSPALLEADCRTVAQMRLVSAVCRFVEVAR